MKTFNLVPDRDRRIGEAREAKRSRREQITRIRTRIAQIGPDDDLRILLGVLKGIMDIIEDDGGDE